MNAKRFLSGTPGTDGRLERYLNSGCPGSYPGKKGISTSWRAGSLCASLAYHGRPTPDPFASQTSPLQLERRVEMSSRDHLRGKSDG